MTNQTLTYNEDIALSPIGWLWFPVLSFALFLVIEAFTPVQYYGYFVNENGLLENAHGITMIFGAIFAYKNLRQINVKQQKFLTFWLFTALLGCIYIAGEEVSWGQHIFNWSTPEGWMAINDQQETNFHNTTSWLDQKPRLMLEIGVIVGGLILPLISKHMPERVPHWLKRIAPPKEMAICAFIFLIVKVGDKVGDFSGVFLFKRASEVSEFYIHFFIAYYLFAMLKRFADLKATKKAEQ